MRILVSAAVLALLGMAGSGVAAPATKRPAAANWTRTFSTTPAGAFVMGNPRAKVKLIEYLSLTCSHCAAFAAEGMPALKRDYIARGLVSLEVRNAVRDGFDLSGTLLARCNGAPAYFGTSEQILAAQPVWIPKAEAYFASGAAGAGQSSDAAAKSAEFARAAGFDQVMRTRGMTPQRITACLSDTKAQSQVAAMADEAWNQRKISGTPAFLINGVAQERTASWASLEPKLKAAVAGAATETRRTTAR